MTIIEMFQQSAVLTVLGMAMVFALNAGPEITAAITAAVSEYRKTEGGI
ncbi:MAG: hypothetical protein LBG74_01490 [Spirochaetaceae bacterium]|jgi:Na+-transporting methylmalonyl-CoA/oxaloacetate decarboxylase gamma subunit|nr:hypothetical protein [Spirochaetaceae bacterium]